MPLSEQEKEKLGQKQRELVQLYFKVKRYIIDSEKASAGSKLSMPAINELRSALDHDMRTQSVLHGFPAPTDGGLSEMEYCETNISKAMGHVFRAGYDALDVISLSIAEDVLKTRDTFSRTALVTVFPNYSDEIRLPFEAATEICGEAKARKDVEADGSGQKHFARYEQAIEDLKKIREKFYARLPELNDVEKERLTEKKLHGRLLTERNIAYVLALVGITAAIIISLIFWWIPPRSEIGKEKDSPILNAPPEKPKANTTKLTSPEPNS